MANVSQIVTTDRRFLPEKEAELPGSLVVRVDEGLRLVEAL
ncbi:MAG TPA: hypothetical protein VF017_05965 [Thermoanaerobaculia bacterium]|nr:hypothetical protein [Thermoanaerobaculia bacterium]